MRIAILLIALLAFLFYAMPVYALVNINTAGAAELDTLPGIGATLAQRIIDYRTQNGPFETIEEIKNVNGIGDSTYNNLKDLITVGETNTQTASATTTQDTATTSTPAAPPPPASAPVSSYVPPPTPKLFAHAGNDRTVIVGAHVEYEGRAYNADQEYVSGVRFSWNFGDGTTAEGERVLHHYEYPGTYVVVLSIAKDRESVSDTIRLKAEPAQLGFLVRSDGSVVIENKSGHDLDLSKWVIRAFYREFVLPEHSIVLPGNSMRVSPKTMGFFAGSETELAYPNGVLAFSAHQISPSPTPSNPIQKSESIAISPKNPVARAPDVAVEPTEIAREDAPVSEFATAAPAATASPNAAAAAVVGSYWWFGAFGLATLTATTAFAIRRMRAKEWEIVEDSQ